jgi:hypothetical protein
MKSAITNLNQGNIIKVANYFTTKQEGKAKDIGVSGAMMTSLCKRGYVQVIRKEEDFLCVGDNLYRKIEINVYAMARPTSRLLADYLSTAEKEIVKEIEKAEKMLHAEEQKLITAQSRINWAKDHIRTLTLRLEALED